MTEFNTSVQFLSGSIDTSNALMEKVRAEYAEIKKENEQLKIQNKKLSNTVDELKDRVRNLEQNSRRTNIEIHGIPETPKEDIICLLKDVGAAIGQELKEEQVMAATQSPATRRPGPRQWWCSSTEGHAWISAFKQKKSITANEINPKFPTARVYINEHLSPENKVFLSQLKEECKHLHFKYDRFRDGKSFVRKNDGEKCHKINKFEDLENV